MLYNAEKILSALFYAIKIRSEGLMGEADSFFGNFLARFKLKTLWQFEGQDRLDSVPIPFFNCDIKRVSQEFWWFKNTDMLE